VNNRFTLQLANIPGGSFTMGNDNGRADERPAHRVTLAPFRAAVKPVCNAEYDAFVQATGREQAPFRSDERFSDPLQPVAGVSWHDAVAYCEWLAAMSHLPLRLPTEAEREFAALGGLAPGTDWPWGNEAPENLEALGGIVHLNQPHVPGPECRNGYGLHCMVDNLHEWCSDWYNTAYYAASPLKAPKGPDSGSRRSSRGGSWRHSVKFNRISARSSLDPTYHYNDYGFRVFTDG
jgi:formylglycine-generating enzyme required for sulfatase activity